MKFFVYGRLKSTERKAWMIPFSKTHKYVLYGYKVLVRPDGAAAMVRGNKDDYVIGEVREARWAKGIRKQLLLWVLDKNEGVKYGVYKRVRGFNSLWYYVNTLQLTDDCKIIHEWKEKNICA